MPNDDVNDVHAAVACLRASMVALGISYEGLVLRQGEEILDAWDAYDVPSDAKLAMMAHPDARLVRSFDGIQHDPQSLGPVVRSLMACSPEMLRMVFEDLPKDVSETSPLTEGDDLGQEEMSIVPMTDADLDCPTCGHVGLEREKIWPAVCLTATEALNPMRTEPPSNRIRSLVAVTMVCPNCKYLAKRPSFYALKEQAMSELIAERLKLSMPIAAKDLREFFQSQRKSRDTTAELLWVSVQDYLVDLGDPSDGVVMAPIEKFVIEADAPEWVEIAIVQLETLGWIENLEGKVFRRFSQQPAANDLFAEPLIEHPAFPPKTLQ